jgi:hypothetical protein
MKPSKLDVERVRQGDVDGLDVRICQQPGVAPVRALDAVLACAVLGTLLLPARDRDHLGPVALPQTGQHGRVDPRRGENAPANGVHRHMIYALVVKLQEVARGLWRWTAPHPDWEPPKEMDSPADWARDVGCVAYDATDALVLIDPLVVDDVGALDRLARSKPRVAILTTLQWHRRSRDVLAKRYKASTSKAKRTLPKGVESFVVRGGGETIFWIPEHGALVPGDRILGQDGGGLRMCPPSWLRYLDGFTQEDLRRALRPLLELPIEMVLVSHGEPILRGGRPALERALAE